MRWFIEVSSGNPTGPAERWVVEALQWQPALQAARALRGEGVETAGFSIELLEDGFRAIDPKSLVRYVVRRAPDQTPLSTSPSASSSQSSVAPSAASPSAAAPSVPPGAVVAAPAVKHASVPPRASPEASSTTGNGHGSPPVGNPSRDAITPSTAPRRVSSPPVSSAPAAPVSSAPAVPVSSAPDSAKADTAQGERIAAMLALESVPPRSSKTPRSASGKSTSPRSVASARQSAAASRPPRPASDAPPPAAAALRASQTSALRAPQVATIAVPEAPTPTSQPVASPAPHADAIPAIVPSAVPVPAVNPAAEPVASAPAPALAPPRPVSHAPSPIVAATVATPVATAAPLQPPPVAPLAPSTPGTTAQPPPPRTITHSPSAPAVVQSLTELQALVQHASVAPRPASNESSVPASSAIEPAPRSAPGSSPEPLPLAELLFQRSEDPSPASPLTYREAAWAVPAGTSTGSAARLLGGMFEGVRAALAGVKPGKLVYMAIFDHHFVGKPTRPPLATLTWKDWKDQGQGPEIRRQGEPRASFQPPPLAVSDSFIPASALPQPPLAIPGAPAVVHPATVAAARSVPAPPASVPPQAFAPPPSAGALLAAVPVPVPSEAPSRVAPVTAAPFAPVAAPFAPPVAAPVVAAPVAVPSASAAPVASVAPVAASVAPAPRLEIVAPDAPIAASEASAPLVVEAPVVGPTSVAPAAPKLVVVPDPEPLPVVAPPSPRVSIPSAPGIRLSGVELIADLFECMHDLHFLPDALVGAEFVMALMMDKLPSAVALVHFYDINAREFVVVRAWGTGAAKVLQLRTSEKEPLIAEAMHKRRAIVLSDASADPRLQSGRWALIGHSRTLVTAPVEQGGRFLGLLELSNPLDGQPFHEGDGHAITYIGEQFAEFLATRGLVLDPDRIGD